MIRGSCLCGSVAFEVRGRVSAIEACHCSRCRKTSGSAFSAALLCASKSFVWLRGESEIAVFALASGFRHAFCKTCGSPVPTPSIEGKVKTLPAGCLDGDPRTRVAWHAFVASKASWFEIADALPRHDERAPRSGA